MCSYETDDERWAAVQARDAEADGVFLYGVITTGIFCYPSCPSRVSLRDNTRFYSSQQAAVEDGLRACRRCQSDKPPLIHRQRQLVEAACKLIDQPSDELSVAGLSDALGVSRFHLQKLFKQFLGLSPKQYMNASRSQRMSQSLNNSESVIQATFDAGYESLSAFYAKDAKRMGMSASTYRQQGKGATIRYAFGRTQFGRIVVATTPRGVCSILFGDTQKELVAELQQRFRQATLIRDSQALQQCVNEVVACIETPKFAQELPLDIQGTAFQEKVWKALRGIAPGTTASYSDIAQLIGKPTASRAVAQACAANPAAVLVPCHRVVSASGALSGYRWGVERKQALLAHENRVAGNHVDVDVDVDEAEQL